MASRNGGVSPRMRTTPRRKRGRRGKAGADVRAALVAAAGRGRVPDGRAGDRRRGGDVDPVAAGGDAGTEAGACIAAELGRRAGDLEGRTLRIAIRPTETGGDNSLARLLADQLQQDLSASPNFRVIASVAVDALRDRPASGLLQTLDADAVLEVSGERQGDSARGRLRIVRAGAEPVVAATPIQPASRMRPLTERLAELSVERLKVGNTIQPSRRSELPLNNPDALQLYREGQNLLRRGGRQDVLDAAAAFREATELEPNFVLAYARWAEALLSVYRHNAIDGEHAFPVAQDAIAQALQRDERSGEAYAALGDLYVEKDRNWTQAEETFRKALTFNPSSEYARIRYALMLAGRGRVDEAVSQILEAQSLNPRSSMLRGYAGATLYYARTVRRFRNHGGKRAAIGSAIPRGVYRSLQRLYGARADGDGGALVHGGADQGRGRAAVRRSAVRADLRAGRPAAQGARASRRAARRCSSASRLVIPRSGWPSPARASTARTKRSPGSIARSTSARRACSTCAWTPGSIRFATIRASRIASPASTPSAAPRSE